MTKPYPFNHESCDLPGPLPEKAVLVIGAGRFGNRAATLLNQQGISPLLIVDRDEAALAATKGAEARRILCDGILFLTRNAERLHPSNLVVPALPIHLVFEWLRNVLQKNQSFKILPVPNGIRPALPHTWEGSGKSLLVSYANFRCPDDCPEPKDHCTVTGKPRPMPLYERLGALAPPGYGVHIVRSRQLAPGLGGYRVKEMMEPLRRLREGSPAKWLIGTACRCHGVLNALEIEKRITGGEEKGT